jgi:hypothetical protein
VRAGPVRPHQGLLHPPGPAPRNPLTSAWPPP